MTFKFLRIWLEQFVTYMIFGYFVWHGDIVTFAQTAHHIAANAQFAITHVAQYLPSQMHPITKNPIALLSVGAGVMGYFTRGFRA